MKKNTSKRKKSYKKGLAPINNTYIISKILSIKEIIGWIGEEHSQIQNPVIKQGTRIKSIAKGI